MTRRNLRDEEELIQVQIQGLRGQSIVAGKARQQVQKGTVHTVPEAKKQGEMEAATQRDSSWFSFYSVWNPSSWDSVTHIQREPSLLS